MADFKTLDDLPDDLTGKSVLVRVDLNVPMDGASVADDTRLRAMLPTVLELSDKGALVLLLSHFGRPKGQSRPDMSTAQLVRPLTELTGRSVRFIEDCQGAEAERAITTMLPGNIGILENTRFHLGEERNDPALAQGMAALGDYYVNDAFSAAHRAHASTEGVARLLQVPVDRVQAAGAHVDLVGALVVVSEDGGEAGRVQDVQGGRGHRVGDLAVELDRRVGVVVAQHRVLGLPTHRPAGRPHDEDAAGKVGAGVDLDVVAAVPVGVRVGQVGGAAGGPQRGYHGGGQGVPLGDLVVGGPGPAGRAQRLLIGRGAVHVQLGHASTVVMRTSAGAPEWSR